VQGHSTKAIQDNDQQDKQLQASQSMPDRLATQKSSVQDSSGSKDLRKTQKSIIKNRNGRGTGSNLFKLKGVSHRSDIDMLDDELNAIFKNKVKHDSNGKAPIRLHSQLTKSLHKTVPRRNSNSSNSVSVAQQFKQNNQGHSRNDSTISEGASPGLKKHQTFKS